MVKRIYQKSRVLGGRLSVLRFIFDEIRQRAAMISGAWGQSPQIFYTFVLLHVQPWLSLIGRDANFRPVNVSHKN